MKQRFWALLEWSKMLAVWGKERKGQEAMYVVWVGLKWVVVVLISLIFSVTQINLTRRMQFKKKTFLIYKFDFISWVRYIWKRSCSFETEGNLLQYLATIWLGSRNWMFRGLIRPWRVGWVGSLFHPIKWLRKIPSVLSSLTSVHIRY